MKRTDNYGQSDIVKVYKLLWLRLKFKEKENDNL